MKSGKVRAVFVDGVGRIREMWIPEAYASYQFPLLPRMKVLAEPEPVPTKVDVLVADFERLGTLADGRELYTQTAARLKYWRYFVDIADETQCECPFDIAEDVLGRWLNTLGRPVVRLYHKATAVEPTGTTRHHFEGVGREVPQG